MIICVAHAACNGRGPSGAGAVGRSRISFFAAAAELEGLAVLHYDWASPRGLRPRHQELHTVEVGQDLDVEVSAGIDVAVDARHPLVVALPLPGDPQARADANEGDEWTGDDGHKRDIGHKDIIPRA